MTNNSTIEQQALYLYTLAAYDISDFLEELYDNNTSSKAIDLLSKMCDSHDGADEKLNKFIKFQIQIYNNKNKIGE